MCEQLVDNDDITETEHKQLQQIIKNYNEVYNKTGILTEDQMYEFISKQDKLSMFILFLINTAPLMKQDMNERLLREILTMTRNFDFDKI